MKKPQKKRKSVVSGSRKPVRGRGRGRGGDSLRRSHSPTLRLSRSLSDSPTLRLTRSPSPRSSDTPSNWSDRLLELEARVSQQRFDHERLQIQAAEHLARTEHLEELLEEAPVGLVATNTHGRIFSANKIARRLLGHPRAELVKHLFTEFVFPADRDTFLRHLRDARTRVGAAVCEITLRRVGKARGFTVQLSSQRLAGKRGEVSQLLIALTDISQRATAERELRATEDTLRTLIEASPHPTQLKDAEGRWQLANAAALELFGLQGQEMHGITNKELAERAPEYRDTLLRRHLQDMEIMLSRRLHRADETIVKPDGTVRILDTLRVPIHYPDGRVKGLVILGHDITARVTAENELRAQQERLRLVVDTALDAVITINEHALITNWNTAAEHMFLRSKLEAVGMTITDAIICERHRAARAYEIREYIANPSGPMYRQRIELTACDAKGREFPVEIALSPANREGETFFSAFVRDISERKLADRRLAGMLAINRILARSGALAEAIPKLLQTICEALRYELGALWLPERGLSSPQQSPSAVAAGEPDPRSSSDDAAGWKARAPSDSPSSLSSLPSSCLHCHTIWQAPDAKLDSFADASNQFTFAPGEGLPGRVWQNVLPVWIPDIAAETNFPRAPFAAKENICTAFAFPILSGTRCLGVMEFFSREKREPDDALFGTVHSIGSQIGQFFERRRAEDAVRESEAQLRLARDQLASANTVLDQRVRERTAELTAANAALEEEIRARAQAERARLRLAAIVESSSDAIASRSLDGKITSWNRAAERTFGWTADEILGQPCATVIPEDHADEVEEAVQRVTNGEMVEPFETVALRKDGRAVPVSLTLSPVRDDEEIVSGISAIIRDISERKELQAEVLRVAEREQRRIAQDLHDGLGQHLAGISCLTNALKKDLAGNSSPDAKTASRISSLLDSAVSQTRNLARGLLPVSTEPNGLMLALGQLAQHLTGLFKVRCHFDCPDPVEVTDSTIAANFYRIAQEAATNSIKHGKARDIAIGLSASPERTVLAITDDGQGIKKTSSRSKGLGLRIMRHRAGVIGGSLIIQKRQGGGTEVICAVEKKGLNGNGTA